MAKAKQIDSSSSEISYDQLADLEGLPLRGDYPVLSSALLKKGEDCLLSGDPSGLYFFDMALKLDPTNADLFYNQGLALFEYGSEEGNEKELTLASKRFKRATSLNPHHFQSWHAWGNTLYFLGKRKKEPSYFLHARKKYEKALSLVTDQAADELADLEWDIGDLWMELAKQSGEATDLYLALKAYEKATAHLDDFPAEFWMNFGDVHFCLGQKTNDLRLYVKAINCYKNSISIAISSPDGWIRLADTLKEIYTYTHDEDHFSQANECYSSAAQLSPYDAKLWTKWADLLLESGIQFQDTKKLSAAIEKCHRGKQCCRKSTDLICIWAQALAFLGMHTEKLELLHQAQSKLDALFESFDPTPNMYYAYGMSMMAFAAYFHDIDYHYQAIERFQEGLSLNRSHHGLWFGMGKANIAAGLLDADEKNFERGCRFFERALNLKITSSYHYEYGFCLLNYAQLMHDEKAAATAVQEFEKAISMQKNVAYQHPNWLFHYAISLDFLADFQENDALYAKSLDLLNHILMSKPDFPNIHAQLALTFSHYAELVSEPEIFDRAFHHYRIAHLNDKENDQIILDWGVTLMNLADLLENHVDSDQHLREAEYKFIQAARLGNAHAYYSLACLYALMGNADRSFYFLEKAYHFDALPPLEELLEDEWLETIRESSAFHHLIEKIETHIQE